MRVLFLFITVCVLVVFVRSSPINPARRLVNRPTREMMARSKREQVVKGLRIPGVKGYATQRTPQIALRKGEYICGNRVCKLKTGEIPKNCNGICQYPVS